MFKRKAICSAVLAASAISQAHAQIEEITVTATKREAGIQDIPVAVSALGEEALTQLGITDFSDYLVQMPGITAGGGGPGTNTIYIRGVASTTPALTTSGVAGLSPNVAFYLDEQPLSQPGRNLDVYTADLERVEVLKGPQGTLFGASSQAGAVRLITNKPDPSGLYGKVKVGSAYTPEGAPSYNTELMINIPVTSAVTLRGVAYSDLQGGYIDNVRGTRSTRESILWKDDNGQENTDLSNVNFDEATADNSRLVEDDINQVTYSGARLAGLVEFNEDWNLLVGGVHQTIDKEGVFFQDPALGELEINRYTEDELDDNFDNFHWTLKGRVGTLNLLYTGAYTERDADGQIDYTDYLYSASYFPYYLCDRTVYSPGEGATPNGRCFSPEAYIDSSVKTEFETHEFRLETDPSLPIRGIMGVFKSDMELRELNNFVYPSAEKTQDRDGNPEGGFGETYSAGSGNNPEQSIYSHATLQERGPWPDIVSFRNDILRTDKQRGVFGELTAEFNDLFTATIGARWYDIEVDLKGSATGVAGTRDPNGTVPKYNDNVDRNLDVRFSSLNPKNSTAPDTASTTGVIYKASLSLTPSADQLIFFTWSEGFRPGILNRPGGSQAKNEAGDVVYTVPFAVDTDDVSSYEVGWKLDMLNNSLRFNGNLFYVDVTGLQMNIFDPSIANLFFSDNAADAEIRGLEGDVTWLASPGLTLNGGFSFLDTEITDSFVTRFVQKGDELSFAPEAQFSLSARYEWDMPSGLTAHVMPNVSYSDKAYTDVVTRNRVQTNSWSLWNVSAGLTSNDKWAAEMYMENLTDQRAEISGNAVFSSTVGKTPRITIARPRTVGLRLSWFY